MFLSPFFLIAAAVGATIPLILHLMQNQRRERVPFPTLRFLKLAQKQSARRIRLENFLLWLIRTAIMALLGLAFAMPMARSRGLKFLGEAPRDVAIILDHSYSMGYESARESVWKKALETARAIIQGLGENDRICLFLADEQPRALIAEPVSDKERGTNLLQGIEPGNGSSQLAPALSVALKALLRDQRTREREVFVITDNQALPWQSFQEIQGGSGEDKWDPALASKQTSIFVALLGAPSPRNDAPVSVQIVPAVVRRGAAAEITAKLSHTGLAGETTATLFLDGKEAGRRSCPAGTEMGGEPARFALPGLATGVHTARLETPEDPLSVDNVFHFLIRVTDKTTALCVGSSEDTLFVRTALRAAAGQDSAAKVIAPDDLAAEPLSPYPCVFLCNALPLSGQALAATEQYVKTGGLIVIFPGPKATIESYATWNCLPAAPSAIEEIPVPRRERTLAWDRPRHPLIEPLRQGPAVPTLPVRRALTWDKLPDPEFRLVSMGPDAPFLLDRPFGKGHVLLFAVAADRTWSDFPLSPFFLPFIAQCIDYGLASTSATPFVPAASSLALGELLPDFRPGTALLDPAGAPVSVHSSLVEGKTEWVADDLIRPGVYSMATPEMRANQAAVPAFAVNLDRRESDLTPLPAERIAELLRVPRLEVATDPETLFKIVEEQRIGRTYGEHLLWLALVLVIIEFLYANFRVRLKPKLSDQLRIDEAGRLRGHATAER